MRLEKFTYNYTNGRSADLYVPPTWAHKRMREAAERLAAQATTREGIVGRRVDQQLQGRVVAMPRDEREAKYDKPLFVAEVRPGGMTRVVMGMGAEHTGALVERLAEEDHYQGQTFQRPEGFERPDYNALWKDAQDMKKRAAQGKKTYGALPKREGA